MQLHDWLDHHDGREQRNLALAWEIVGKSGREILEIWSLVTGCKVGQGGSQLRWKEREACSAWWKDGEGGFIIDVKKKSDTL